VEPSNFKTAGTTADQPTKPTVVRWYEGLENAEGISVKDLPDAVQKRLKAVVREIRRLEEVAKQG
jgi:hypothetical protein